MNTHTSDILASNLLEEDVMADSLFEDSLQGGSKTELSAQSEAISTDDTSAIRIIGDSRSNILNGSEENERIEGRRGNDTLRGLAGNDHISGGSGADILKGGRGNDVLEGNRGSDVLEGGRGDDVLRGGRGSDVLKGGRGDDVLRGGRGSDVLKGGRGDDVLQGGQGDDILRGGRGTNRLNGGEGVDTLVGGSGTDTFILESPDSIDIIRKFNGSQGDRTHIAASLGATSLSQFSFDDQTGILSFQGQALALLISPLDFSITESLIVPGLTDDSSPPSNPPNEIPTETIFIEAEDLALSPTYRIEDNEDASGGQLISLLNPGMLVPGEIGTATLDFTGIPGTYNIVVGYFDESDGIGQLEVSVGNTSVGTLILDENTNALNAEASSFRTFTIPNQFLSADTVITLTGTASDPVGEWIRIDYVELVPVIPPDPGETAIAFSVPTYSVSESDSTASITLTREGNLSGTFSVEVNIIGVTASGEDYTVTSPVLVTFGDGETEQDIVIPIIDDELIEGTETASLSLSNPTNNTIIGTLNTAVLRIEDNDPMTIPNTALFTSEDTNPNQTHTHASQPLEAGSLITLDGITSDEEELEQANSIEIIPVEESNLNLQADFNSTTISDSNDLFQNHLGSNALTVEMNSNTSAFITSTEGNALNSLFNVGTNF